MSKETNLMLLNRLGAVLQTHVEPIFKPGVKFTLIARTPGNNEGDVFVSSDELPEVEALIERSKLRDDITTIGKPNEAAMEAAKKPSELLEAQIDGLLQGQGATEDHENVLKAWRRLGLPEALVLRIHRAVVNHEVTKPFAWALIPRAGSTVKVRAFKETEPTAEDLEFAAMEGETYVPLYL